MLVFISTHEDPDVRMRITRQHAVIFDFPGPKKEKKENPESCENPRLLFHGPMPTTSLSSTTRRVLVLDTPLRFR